MQLNSSLPGLGSRQKDWGKSMIDVYWCLELSILVSELVLGIVVLFLVSLVHDSDGFLRRFYRSTIVLLMLIALHRIIEKVVRLYTDDVRIIQIGNVILLFLYFALIPLMTSYLVYLAGEEVRGNRTVRLVRVLRGLLLAEAVFFSILDFEPSFDPKTLFQWVAMILSILLSVSTFVVDIVNVAVRWKKLSIGQRIFFIVGLFFISIWMLPLMEVLILREQHKRYIKLNEELIKKKTQIAVLQMRPHFVYNTLITIYYLCKEDPAKAQKAVLDFSRYLQANFTAISSEENIPFTTELEHTRAYLAVEKVRYEDKLYIEYDTPVTMFDIPPLTLQPIVENAVKYGISPGQDPLYVTIRTEGDDKEIRIIVEDTGPGYSPPDDKEPHLALDNIRSRLDIMCASTLEIAAREAGGTIVTIRIPIRRDGKKNRS